MFKSEKFKCAELDYQDGYRDGRADRLLGISPLIVAVTSIWPSYAAGYHDGYNAAEKQTGMANLTKGAES